MELKYDFSMVQRRLISEFLKRQEREFNDLLRLIYKEMGIEEVIRKPGPKWVLRKDFSGLDREDSLLPKAIEGLKEESQ